MQQCSLRVKVIFTVQSSRKCLYLPISFQPFLALVVVSVMFCFVDDFSAFVAVGCRAFHNISIAPTIDFNYINHQQLVFKGFKCC